MSDLGKQIGDRLTALAERAADGVPAQWHVTVDLLEDEDEGVRHRWYSCDVDYEFRSELGAIAADIALRQFLKLCDAEGLEVVDEGGGPYCVGCEVVVRLPDEPV